MKSIVVVLALAASCIVGDAGPGPGAGSGNHGGGGAPDAAQVGGGGSGSGTACTGAVYDPCTDAAQCASGNCLVFQQQGFQVCTQTCTVGNNASCPTQNGVAATCNNKGLCKPAAANSCTR